MRPGSAGRNIIIAALYLWMIALWPVFVGYYVGRNRGESAEKLSRLPGISANGGLLTGVVVSIGGYVLLLTLIAATTPGTDTDTATDGTEIESTADGVGEQPTESTSTDDATETSAASSGDTTDGSGGGAAGESGTSDESGGGSVTDSSSGSTDGSSDGTTDSATDDSTDGTTGDDTNDDSSETTDGTTGDSSDGAGDSTTGDGTGDSSDETADSTGDTTDDNSDSDADTGDTSDGDNTVTVEVVDVIDGDTMDIEYENETDDRVRLLGVDTPEVHTSVSTDEFEGVPDSEAGRQCLDGYGDEASAFAEQELAGDTVQLQFDSLSDRRGSYDRLLVYIIDDGENFNHLLLEEGMGRVYDSTFTESERFYDTEAQARDNQTGVWSCQNADDGSSDESDSGSGGSQASDSALEIVEIHEDASGNDHENLNDEYVTFRNEGDEALELSGWTVEDEADHQYTVPSGFTLQAGEEVTLHTGDGTDTDTDLYWGSGRAVWNNGGDTVFVNNADGEQVIEREY